MSVAARITGRLRRARPERVVRREVQGVELLLPWSHRLPDYAERYPAYGQNLVVVADAVAAAHPGPFLVVDIGGNVGDSALQVLAKVDAQVLSVEGDPYWLDFLRRNVAREPRVRVEAALVLPDGGSDAHVEPLRRGGTTRFVESASVATTAVLTPDELRARNSDLGPARLVKSDTDGYDARIVPAVARAWADVHPVLFFEYDPAMSRSVGDDAPERVWPALEELGYERVFVWDNFGGTLGVLTVDEAPAAALVLDSDFASHRYHYWDVAVVHRDDHEVLHRLRTVFGAPDLPETGRAAG